METLPQSEEVARHGRPAPVVERYQAGTPPWAGSAPDCAVVLVSYNGAAYLSRCLEALSRQTYGSFEVILVDNASRDDSLAVARAQAQSLPRLTIVSLSENRGFAGGNNAALSEVSPLTEFVALLNTDAFPEPEWLASLVGAARRDPQVGLATGKILEAQSPHRIDACGDVLNSFGVPRSRGRGAPRERYPGRDCVFGGCAASLLIRTSLLRELGYLFDGDLFCYGEDVDLAYRVQARGYRCLYVGDAISYHLRSAASPGQEAWRHGLSRRNLWVVFMRYHRRSPSRVALFLLYWLAGDLKLLVTGRLGVLRNQYRMLILRKGIRP
jgi:GT2 family glycosyltransferase